MKEVKICPFCGKKPVVDEKNQTVHCETLDCAIHSWYINIEEWEQRAVEEKNTEEENK